MTTNKVSVKTKASRSWRKNRTGEQAALLLLFFSIRTQVLFLLVCEACFPLSLIYLISQNAAGCAPEFNQILETLDGTGRLPDPFTCVADLQGD